MVEQRDFGAVGQALGVGGGEQVLLVQVGDIQAAARFKQRMLAETLRRRFIECPAGAGQRLDLFGAIGLHEHGRRTPRGVITRLGFTFQYQHLLRGCQPVPERGTGNTAANDHAVERLRHNLAIACSRSRNYHL
ncbi:hypothetical protein D3C73_1356700 [compost metagenome]